MRANIVERGNGFPDPGDYVAGDDGNLYIVVRSGSRIETQGVGRGNICIGYDLDLADWADLADDQEPVEALAIVSDEDA